jgi:peptidoglycan lytic transglycosylase
MLKGWSKFKTAFFIGFLMVTALPPFAGGGMLQGNANAATPANKKNPAKSAKPVPKAPAHSSGKGKASAKKTASGHGSAAAAKRSRQASRRVSIKPTPQSIRLTSAFHATEQLRPMAQQLAMTRSAQAYSGVQAYARTHPGEAAATAYLALGHACSLDRRYSDAVKMYRQAASAGKALDDYADYLGAQAALQAGQGTDAYALLDHFEERHPDSIFDANAPVLLATSYVQQNDPQGALRVLEPLADTPLATHSDFRYIMARAYQISGDTGRAAAIFRSIYTKTPLSSEAGQSQTQLDAMGVSPTASERKVHADQLFNAKRYAEAGAEYHTISRNGSGLSQADRDALAIYAAVCDMKLKHISRRDVEKLPETTDDSAALKMYMLAELSRSDGDGDGHDAIISQMIKRFPKSRWLEEALYSGGNMYLLKHDFQQAIYHYSTLVQMFPNSTYAPSAHWRAAWLNYRLRNYTEAARLMDEQIQRYSAGIEAPSAIYWRGRIYEDEEHNMGQAVNYYRVLISSYVNYYYADLARRRLAILGTQPSVPPAAVLSAVRAPSIPFLSEDLPENEPHLIKARLLANAALNEYIAPEIQASPTSAEWGALAQAEIFTSYGEYTRALQAMKRSGISFFSIPVDQVPAIYWQLMFPRPYWSDLMANSERNGIDPQLVASLIRQESEFNPGAVSRANAYGLMQLLPSVGKSLAKKQGIKGFKTPQLLNPSTNLQLGTLNLKQVLDRFGGQQEYALAAYNAGDVPVRQWMSNGEYKDIAEFVESIPYTETREYVQAIIRNRQMYKTLYASR